MIIEDRSSSFDLARRGRAMVAARMEMNFIVVGD
jgi:hypothetical protein